MDSEKTGALIAHLRHELGLTQKQLAERLHISDRTVSKWERGAGCPDISMLPELVEQLDVPVEALLSGELSVGDPKGANMRNATFYVCPTCGHVTVTTGDAELSCCGTPLEALELKKAEGDQRIHVDEIEDEWYITSEHPMKKEHYISFVAFVTGDRVQLVQQFPEWNLQTRIQKRGHGRLVWHCTRHGGFYQLL